MKDSKEKEKKVILNIIVLSILFILSFSMFKLYPNMEKVVRDKSEYAFGRQDFQKSIKESTYGLYFSALEKKEGKTLRPSEVFLKNNNIENEEKNYIDERIYSWESNLKDNMKNLEYYLSLNNGEVSMTNSKEELGNILMEDSSETEEALKNEYRFYMVLNFNENGVVTVTKVYGGEFKEISNKFGFSNWDISLGDKYSLQGSNIKNLKIIYAVPKNLEYKDSIWTIANSVDSYFYGDAVVIYILIAATIVVFLALIIPYKYEKDILGYKIFFKIPLEIIFTLGGLCIGLLTVSPMLVYATSNRDIFYEIIKQMLGIEGSSVPVLVDLINIFYWAFLGYIAFLFIVVIKGAFKEGLSNYFKNYTIIGRTIRFIKRKFIKVYKDLMLIDLEEKSNKILIKIVLANFILLLIIWAIGLFVGNAGVGILIVYSLVLFFILRRYFEEIKEKYNILLKGTNKVAEGNLDVKIQENLGLFEPLKRELEKIQRGFKLAVEKEVKGEKMKTELITNVSHDLKTPLTSIITYIDLLKKEDITEEERNSYIDIINRKAERLKRLIEDLFDISKANTNNVQLNIVKVDIVSLLKQVKFELEDKIEEANLNFRWNLPEEKVILPLDSEKTFRVFENIINNIIKYAMTGSRVYIEVMDKGGLVQITLKNISRDEIDFKAEEIVERFVRGDKSRNTEGSGLGLAIAKRFVEIQGGTLKVEIDGDLFKVIIEFKKDVDVRMELSHN